MKKLLLVILLSSVAFAQSEITIIPVTDPTTGAPSATGTIVMRDLEIPPNTVAVRAPSTVSTSYQIVWPTSISAGCLVTDASGNMSVDATCTGTSISGTTPLVYSSGVISCPTCLTTAGGQTVTSSDTFTSGENFGSFLWLGQWSGSSFSGNWALDGSTDITSNQLDFRNSSSVTVASLGYDGTGWKWSGPTVNAVPTSGSEPAGIFYGNGGSQTADIFDVYNGGPSPPKALWVDSSGGTHINTCASGCTASDMMTTDTAQTASGQKTWTNSQQFGNYLELGQWSGSSFALNWSLDASTDITSNRLDFRDNSSVTRMFIDDQGGSSNGWELGAPSLLTAPTNNSTVSAIISGYSTSPTADILDVDLYYGGTKELWVDSSGGTHIANCVAGCGGTYTGTSPISVSGTAVSCPNCLTTAGGQTISSADSFSNGINIGTSSTGGEIAPLLNGSGLLGDSSHYWSQIYLYSGLFLAPGSGVVEWGPSDSANLNSAGGATFQSGVTFNSGINDPYGSSLNSTVWIGYSGNFYTRLISSSTGVSCSGTPDGWLAVSQDGYVVVCGNGVRSRAALVTY